nr:reverse transcriptase, RNA-dependent DNA polymerase [Tanacetum cinerariifolium]
MMRETVRLQATSEKEVCSQCSRAHQDVFKVIFKRKIMISSFKCSNDIKSKIKILDHKHAEGTAKNSQDNKKTSYEKLYGKVPSYDHLMVIGCLCYAAVTLPHRDKLDPKGIKNVVIKEQVILFKTPVASSAEKVGIFPVFCSSDEHVEASKYPKWVQAMQAKLDALEKNQTWELTYLPIGHKAISSKWVYKIKYKASRKVDRYKARLVIRGFDQKEGTDYKHTFSPVAKRAPVRVLITLATAKGWPLHQLDINNAFLHCFLEEGIYLLKYLKGTVRKGLFYPVQPHLQITGFLDADWAACLMTRRSLTGYCIFLGHSLVSWKTNKQPMVSRSSTEAEYRAMAVTTCEILWLIFLLKNLHIPVKLPITLFYDNKSARQLAANPCFHERSKHLDMNCHFIRLRWMRLIHELGTKNIFVALTDLEVCDVEKERVLVLRKREF